MIHLDLFDARTRDLQESLADAECTLEELNESGDLEDRLQASFAVTEAQQRLTAHLLKDHQEDQP